MNNLTVILVIIAALSLIAIWRTAFTLSKSRSQKVVDFTHKFCGTLASTMNEMGVRFADDSGSDRMDFFSFTIVTSIFCSEERMFDKVKAELSKHSVDILVDGVRAVLPYGVILEQVDHKGDIEGEIREATMAYVKAITSANNARTPTQLPPSA